MNLLKQRVQHIQYSLSCFLTLLCCIRDVLPTTMHTMDFFHIFIIGHLVELTN